MYHNNSIAIANNKSVFETGFKFFEALGLAIKSALWKKKDCDEGITCFLNAIKEGSTVIDVGSHTHDYLAVLLQICTRAAHLIVFEKEPDMYYQIKEKKKIYNLKNLVLEPFAHQLVPGKIASKFLPAKKDEAIVIDFETGINKESAAPLSLDAYCDVKNIQPAVIRITAYRDEPEILNGASHLLEKYKPTIFLECEERHSSRAHILNVFKLLADRGYSGYFILDTIKIPVRNFDFNIYQNPRANFYCRHFIFQ